jgi:hypothetical protein
LRHHDRTADDAARAATGSIVTAGRALGTRLRGLPAAPASEMGNDLLADHALHCRVSSTARSGEKRSAPPACGKTTGEPTLAAGMAALGPQLSRLLRPHRSHRDLFGSRFARIDRFSAPDGMFGR